MSGYVGIASLLVILIAGIGLFIYGASHTNGVLVVLGYYFVSWGYFYF